MKKTFIFCILFFLLGSVFILQPTPYQILKLKTFDAFVQKQDPSGWFVTLDITEEDVAAKDRRLEFVVAVDRQSRNILERD